MFSTFWGKILFRAAKDLLWNVVTDNEGYIVNKQTTCAGEKILDYDEDNCNKFIAYYKREEATARTVN